MRNLSYIKAGITIYRNGPKRTETDRNGPKRTFVETETDSLSTETDYLGTKTDRNGPKRTFVDTETDSLSTETDSLGTETDRNGPKRTFVDTETDSLSTKTDSLGTETDFCEYRNGLCGYRILIWGVKIDRNTKNRYKLQCQAVQIGYVE